MKPETVDVILDAVKLVRTQLEIRDRRRANEPDERVRAAVTATAALRRAWWTRAQQADQNPLVQLTLRLSLEPDEVDMLVAVLVAELDTDVRDAIVRPRGAVMTADAIVDTLFHESRKRFDARRLITPVAPLVRHGLLALRARGLGLGADDTEVRPSEALMTFALGRPLAAGPLARYCQMSRPEHAWADVILPDREKQRVWELVTGAPALRKSLEGLAVLFEGPAGTGKAMFAHGLAERLGRPILKVRTPCLARAGDAASGVLADVLGVAAPSRALVLIEDCELLFDASGRSSLALLEALDQHVANDGVVILTCNDPARVDAALARRIAHRLTFWAPNAAARSAIWRVCFAPAVAVAPDVDLDALAADYPIVGARIRDAVVLATAMMAARGEERLTMATLREAADAQRDRVTASE